MKQSIIGFVKDLMIVSDFIVSCIGGFLKNSYPELSNSFIYAGVIFLVIAVVCIIIERISNYL